MWQVTAIAEIYLPRNIKGIFFAVPNMVQPVNTKGDANKIIFLLPNQPPSHPPKGHKNIPVIQNEPANHEPK